MVDCSLLPNVEDFFDILRENVAYNRSTDVSLLHKSVAHELDRRVPILCATFEVCVQIGQRLPPVCRHGRWTLMLLLAEHVCISQALKLTIIDRSQHCVDKRVLFKLKVALLDLIVEVRAILLCNEKSKGSPATLESDLSSVGKVADQQVLLDQAFNAFIPVCVPRDRFLNSLRWIARGCHEIRSKLFCSLGRLTLFFFLLRLRLAPQLVEEIICTFDGKGVEVVGKRVLGDHWRLIEATSFPRFITFLGLFSKVVLGLEGNLLLVKAKLSEEIIARACGETLEGDHLELLASREGLTSKVIIDVAHGATADSLGYLLVELVHFLGDLLLLGSADLGHNLQAAAMERHELATKTEACSAFRVKPSRRVASTGLLARNRLGKCCLSITLAWLTDLLGTLRMQR